MALFVSKAQKAELAKIRAELARAKAAAQICPRCGGKHPRGSHSVGSPGALGSR